MKFKFMLAALCLFFCSITSASAEEYVVKFNDSISLLGIEQSFADKFTTATEDEVDMYIEAGIVEYYEPVVYAELLETSDWQLSNIKAEFPKKIGAWGDGIKVAVIDSGINVPDALSGLVLPGYDYHGKTNDVTDEAGHGTFVSSMIAMDGSGPAINCFIVPLKVFYKVSEDKYTASSFDLANAIIGAVDDFGCSVINLSLSVGTSSVNHLKEAIDYAVGKGAIVVAAVGNDGNKDEVTATALHYPAAYDNVIGVGSVNKNKEISYFSQRNGSVYVVAQGEDVTYSDIDDGKQINYKGSGTSFAAPQVSGLAAIAKCIYPGITCKDFMGILKTKSEDLGAPGYDTSYGYGLINCEEVVGEMIKDRKVYISPVKTASGKALSVMYNNTGAPLKFTAICALDDKVSNMAEVVLDAGNVGYPNIAYSSGTVKFMAWDGLKNISPLSPSSDFSSK